MKRSKFTDEQILAIVKEGEAGRKVADLCRANGITEQATIAYVQTTQDDLRGHYTYTRLPGYYPDFHFMTAISGSSV